MNRGPTTCPLCLGKIFITASFNVRPYYTKYRARPYEQAEQYQQEAGFNLEAVVKALHSAQPPVQPSAQLQPSAQPVVQPAVPAEALQTFIIQAIQQQLNNGQGAVAQKSENAASGQTANSE